MSRCRVSHWLLAGLLFVAGQALGQSERICEHNLIYHEARGENLIVQRAVLEVARARAKKSGKSVCEVLQEPHQFPWRKRGLKKVLALSQQARYDSVRNMSSNVLPDQSFLFFNSVPHRWSYKRIKLGGLTFNNIKERKHGC